MIAEQLELFALPPAKDPVVDYWQERLNKWPGDVRHWRHYRNTTGWSMACGAFCFAKFLFRRGEMTRKAYRRWWKFNRRVRRWDLRNTE